MCKLHVSEVKGKTLNNFVSSLAPLTPSMGLKQSRVRALFGLCRDRLAFPGSEPTTSMTQVDVFVAHSVPFSASKASLTPTSWATPSAVATLVRPP